MYVVVNGWCMKFRNPFKTRIAYICTPTKNYHIEVPFLGTIKIIPQELLNLKGKRIEYLIVDESVPVHNDTSIHLISTPMGKNYFMGVDFAKVKDKYVGRKK